MKDFKFGLGLGIAAALLCALPMLAQLTSGNLTGSVYDPAGATVPGATVIAHNVATGVENTTTSTSAGVYLFENLPVGTYNVSVTAPGFAKAEVNNLAVELNQTITTNLTLSISKATTTVEVTTAAVAIDTSTAQIQNTFNTKTIEDLPVTATGSGVLNLALLAPGVGTSGGVGAGSGPTVGGQRPRNNNFTVEGIDNNSGSVTGPLVSIPNDAVAEFTTLQNQYSPEFGHSSGGQFNQVVKSGTNDFHGMLYEYFQNRNLNAADNLNAVSGAPLHPRFDNNRFGGNVGGPIKRNKLFFFVDYEYNPIGSSATPGLTYSPTSAGYSTLSSIPGISQTNLSILKKYLPPAPTACSGGTCPTEQIASLANGPAYLNGFPANATSIQVGQLPISAPSYTNNENGVASIDYTISDKDSLRGRFVLNRTGAVDTAAQLPVFFTTIPTNNYLIAVSEYHNFSPTVINELRLGYNRNYSVDPVGNFTFPGLDQFPNLYFNDLGVQIGPDPNAPQGGIQNLYELTDNLTWSKGSHDIRIGFDGTRNISPQFFTQRSRGDYEYTNLNDYLFDFTPDSLAQRSTGSSTYWGNRYLFGWYVNDLWKIRSNLTINLGLRYEFETVPASENEQDLNAISDVPGLITFSSPKPQYNNIMPRVGFAYSPGTSGKTSIRAGYSIAYDVLYDNLGLLTLPPQLSTTEDETGVDYHNNGYMNFLALGGLPPNGASPALSVADARAGTGGYIPNVTRPEAYSWNFGVQHEFGDNYVFESQYIGTRGLHLDVQDQINRQPIVNASNALPVYFTAPSQATLNSLPNTLSALTGQLGTGNIVPAYLQAGFTGIITSYQPYGDSVYHGWANQLRRRFSNGLQFIGSYTWSHDIDNSTADVFSTVLTPRRPQNSQNLSLDRASSALDHRNRLSFELLYDFMPFKNRNWFMKNVIGNWELAPIYTYQTGTLYTPQSATDSNLNGDSWPDRPIINPSGNVGLGSGVTALTNSAGATVAYLVNNPSAMFIEAPKGTISTAGRNLLHMNPIDDIDITAMKRFNFTERVALQFEARAFNIFNHPQYVAGFLNDVGSIGFTGNERLTMEPQDSLFQQISQEYSSNPRNMVLTLKLIF